MSNLQAFKATDSVEKKVQDVFVPVLDTTVADALDEFYEECYEAYPLGDVLYDTGHPLANVLPKDVFRTSYPAIHQLFTRAGTFEFYLSVFRSVWGSGVEVEFNIPDPGKLEINIDALIADYDTALARRIVSGSYVYDELVTDAGDNIVFQGSSGIKTQRETDAMIRELHPSGIWVETTLSIS